MHFNTKGGGITTIGSYHSYSDYIMSLETFVRCNDPVVMVMTFFDLIKCCSDVIKLSI